MPDPTPGPGRPAGRLDPSVFVPAPRDEVYAYFADPANRPRWQRSLRRVELLDPGPPHVGQRWVDHLAVGPPFELQISAMEPPEVWAEVGTTGPFTALVTLLFSDAERDGVSGTLLRCVPRIRARGALRPLGWPATAAIGLLVRDDLRRIPRLFT